MPKHYRDAGSGEYVTRAYAEEHPDTTVSETDQEQEKQADGEPEDRGRGGDQAAST